MQMAQRTVANKSTASGVQRSALLPARPRSVIARFRDDERPVEVEQKRSDKVWVDVHSENPVKTNESQVPVKPMPRQEPGPWVQRVKEYPEYDQGEPKVAVWSTAFTRRREIFAGRLAMVGLSAACFWEYILPNHPNITEQVSYVLQNAGLTSATSATGATLIGLLVLQNAVSALAPWSASFSEANLRDVAKRPAGPPTRLPANPNPLSFLGIAELGAFSKANELFNGRLAMLGFAAAVVQQLRMGGAYGPGPVAQVAEFLNMQPEQLFLATPLFFAAWPLFWTVLAFVRGKFGGVDTEKEIF